MKWEVEAEDIDDLLNGNFAVIQPLITCENCTKREYSDKYGLSWCGNKRIPDVDFYCRDGKGKAT